MHELALIQDLLDNVRAHAKRNGVSKVTKINLIVGKLSGALPHALEFGFNVIKKGTELEGAILVIAETDPIMQCHSCEHKYTSTELVFACEQCGGNDIEIIEGKDIILEKFEGMEGENANG
ncbi:hydrogenase maturation nickel metallochaperone HypA [Desulfosporosinus sp. Sb-LF]|uniref:hydrogenase maturation nickel metallochaperone HypA n=1 Tax=Desulfosporosinus sp. Sb-LF TaxID=2560027 RepID=UPI0013052D89|nr:hydrogenase maturation nickel metallochaperone HypA [Desulfosporosinus sp. Sb-LF]